MHAHSYVARLSMSPNAALLRAATDERRLTGPGCLVRVGLRLPATYILEFAPRRCLRAENDILEVLHNK